MEKLEHNDNRITAVKAKKWLTGPHEKITVIVIGCGGTGSQVLQGLARMNYALENLGHEGFHVIAYDSDIVTIANRGRQLFAESDLNCNKAAVLISKINRYYGYDWEFKPVNFDWKLFQANTNCIIMTCVDKVDIRHKILHGLKSRPFQNTIRKVMWMDFGNDQFSGQVILGEYGNVPSNEPNLKGIEHYGIAEKDDPDTPSCSLAEALLKQDLMINTMVANTGMTMLWQGFTKLKFTYNASFINLKSMQIKSSLNYEISSKN
jgi:PRTRC genetic system ThiF family protein